MTRTISIRAPEMIRKVRNFVTVNRSASLRMMEDALNSNKETTRANRYENLDKTKVSAKFIPHTLNDYQKLMAVKFKHHLQLFWVMKQGVSNTI